MRPLMPACAHACAALSTRSVHWLFLNAAIGDVAGSVWNYQPRLTPQGHEVTVATNYLGHYALVLHLLPALSLAAPSRVVSVTCGRHQHAWPLASIHDNLQLLRPGTWFKARDPCDCAPSPR